MRPAVRDPRSEGQLSQIRVSGLAAAQGWIPSSDVFHQKSEAVDGRERRMCNHRVVLYAEDSLSINHFAMFRVPVPPEFQGNGRRTMRVSLAFGHKSDEPVAEHIGTNVKEDSQ